MTDLDFCVPENAKLEWRREYLSDSGEYKVVITPYTTKEGYGHTQGLVYKVGSDVPIAEVRRNYSSFEYTFIEDHPNGHPYFVGGADYQGQTVIELDTGRRRDYLPEEAEQGWGFCWVDYRFDAQSKILVVEGCIWAAPFEHRFFDFSDPMQGWPALEFEGVFSEGRWPEISKDLVRCYEPEPDAEDVEFHVPMEHRGWASIRTYRRHGNELQFVSVWVSPVECRRRVKRAEEHRRYTAWRKEFRATDFLYLEFKRQLTDPKLSPEDNEGVGITYKGWCPDFTGEESRWCRRIIHDSSGYTVDLEWAVKTGPIKLAIFRDGKTDHSKFFEHSVEGMRGYPGDPVYGAMKAAVAAFTTDLAVSQGRNGIRVNGIGPVLSQTPQVVYLSGYVELDHLWESWAPVGRLGWPEDQARVALFLASDLSSFVTGHNVPVDGGTKAGGGWFWSPSAKRFVNRPTTL